MICQRCGHRRYPGRGRIHDSGECLRPWYRQRHSAHPRRPGRPPDDLPAELIERIMARRAKEQRYERAMSHNL